MNRLRSLILSFLEKKYDLFSRKVVPFKVLDQEIRIIKGTFSQATDYDDAWGFLLAKNSEVIFDVGANIGHSAILFLLSGGINKIILIDPNPQALGMAAENLFLNNLSRNAVFIPAFASNESEAKVRFWTVGPGAAGSMFTTHAVSARKRDSSYLVPTITLDDLAAYQGISPDFVKIDVEGAESLVLAGARNIAGKGPKFLIEMHSNPELSMEQNASNVLHWCTENDYCAWYLKEHCLL